MSEARVKDQPTVVVTGGSAGIGWGICEDLAGRGYRVISVARRKPPHEAEGLFSYEVDLADPVATAEAAAQIAWVLDNRGFLASGATLSLTGGALP